MVIPFDEKYVTSVRVLPVRIRRRCSVTYLSFPIVTRIPHLTGRIPRIHSPVTRLRPIIFLPSTTFCGSSVILEGHESELIRYFTPKPYVTTRIECYTMISDPHVIFVILSVALLKLICLGVLDEDAPACPNFIYVESCVPHVQTLPVSVSAAPDASVKLIMVTVFAVKLWSPKYDVTSVKLV